MISRKSARLLAEAYDSAFSTITIETQRTSSKYKHITGIVAIPDTEYDGTEEIEHYQLRKDELYEFFYDKDYETWFLNIIENLSNLTNRSILKSYLMDIHTGKLLGHFRNPHDHSPEVERIQAGQALLRRLAQDIIKLDEDQPARFSNKTKEKINILKSQLEFEGYIYRNKHLYSVESAVIDPQAEQSYLESLVDSLGLSDPVTIKHHIQLAEEDYGNSRWSNSIGNSRHFLEAILAQVLERVSTKLARNLNPTIYKNATATRNHLEREELLTQDEKETIGRIYGLLSNTGGHAYIAEKDQARLMWHLALTCSQFALLRYEGFVRAHP
ncbi:MAG: hypothetical protein AUG51_19655 [Acidobacteria bacterium 13_1_20CM_3_53_8]|nr:MAG: hypothetical protein AUG51_19655 [Acidobacteria bacterium 13_1_20CM_3_53_8]